MLIWCAHCQTLIGERPPYFSYSLSHSICSHCATRIASADGYSFDQDKIEFFDRLLAAGQAGDLASCLSLRDEGLALGIAAADLVFAAVSGVLSEIGTRWERGEITVADEHRATRWCETFLAGLPRPPRSDKPLDIFGTVTPNNRHILGPRLAEYVLNAHGINTEVVVPGLPMDELLQMVHARKPRHVAISCGIPPAFEEARQMCEQFRANGYAGGLLLVGAAVRREDPQWPGLQATSAKTLWEVMEIVQAGDPSGAEAPLAPARSSTPPGDPGRAARDADAAGRQPATVVRVMVVDDEAIMCKMITHALGSEHYNVATFSSAVAALESIRAGQRYDVILADVRMPDMSGIEFFQALTRQVPDQAARLAFITGDVGNPQLQALLSRTGNECLRKPFSREPLRQLVERIAAAPGRLR